MKQEHIALISLCLNNAGVDAFERGHLGKALKFFQVAVNIRSKISSSAFECSGKLSKKMLRKVIKSQSKSFAPKQDFDIAYSKSFGKYSRHTRRLKLILERFENSSTYIFQKVFSIKASNSLRMLEQTSTGQLNAVICFNLAICHHLCQGHIGEARQHYELVIQSSCELGCKILLVACWNNLLHIFSNDLLEEGQRRCCLRAVVQILCQCNFSDHLSRLKGLDRRGILFNLILFSSSGNLAPAA
jgi:hypothetical protein